MTSSPRHSQACDSEQPGPTYEVGYGRPPVHTRVKPGQVLNPRGRPKGQRNVSTVLRKALNQPTKIRQGNRVRSVTKLDAFILKLINDAGLGNAKAQASLIALMRAAGLMEASDVPPSPRAALTPDDGALIADFFKRKGDELGIEHPSASSATEPGKEPRKETPS